MIRAHEEDGVSHQKAKKLRVSSPFMHNREKNEDESCDYVIEEICKSGKVEELNEFLSKEKNAAFCLLYLEKYLQLALQHKQEKIINLLVEYYTGKQLDFFELLTLIVTSNSYQHHLTTSCMDSQVTKLVDAGLNSGHLTQALRYCSQAEDGIKVLLRNGADINIIGKRGKTALFFFFRGSSCFGDNMSNYVIFRNHIKKMQIVGLPMSQDNTELYKEIQKKYEQGYLEIYRPSRDPAVKELEKCREECKKLKDTKLNERISLHDVLFKDQNQLATLVSNEHFRNTMLDRRFKFEFRNYGYLLRLQFRKGLLRRALLDAALMTIPLAVTTELDDDCSLQILKLLSNSDLTNVIKAAFVNCC